MLSLTASGADAERFMRAGSNEQWVRWEVWPWRAEGGEVNGIVIMTEDVTAKKLADRRIREAALHDKLTGLPNRARFLDCLKQSVQSAQTHGHTLAVLFVDLDNFRRMNDVLGHVVGDALVQRT